MNILFIADVLPERTSGSAVRNYYLLKALSKEHNVDVIALNDTANHNKSYEIFPHVKVMIVERKQISFIQKITVLFKGDIPYIYIREHTILPEIIQKRLQSYDVIHLAELNSYFFIHKYLKRITVPVILDAHNIEYTRLKAEIKNSFIIKKILGNIILLKLKNKEIAAAQDCTHLLTCSAIDQSYFKNFISINNISIIPNGVDAEYFGLYKNNDQSKKINILFMGLLSYFPNNEALQYYFKSIYPFIKSKYPNSEFKIIGKSAPRWLVEKAKLDRNITLTGFVSDIRPYIAHATLCIAPLLSGSGTRLKILEYMAMKKAVVATLKACEGIEIIDLRDLYIARNSHEFIRSVDILLQNSDTRTKLGKQAYNLIIKKYQWEDIGNTLRGIYKEIKK